MRMVMALVCFFVLLTTSATAQTTFPFVPLQAGWDLLVQASNPQSVPIHANLLGFYSREAPKGLLNVGIQEVDIQNKVVGGKEISFNFGFSLETGQVRQFLITDETGIGQGWMLSVGPAKLSVFWVKDRTQIKALPAQIVSPGKSFGIVGNYGPATGLALLNLGSEPSVVTIDLIKDGDKMASTTVKLEKLEQLARYLGQLFPEMVLDVYTIVFRSKSTLALDLVNFN